MKDSTKQWYVAVLIVQARVRGHEEKRPLFDRQIKVLQASTHEEAYKKALALGKAETHFYLNPQGEKVCWRFLGLANLSFILEKEIFDGVEVYSTLQRGNGKNEVVRKESLSVFWYEAHKHMKAGDLLAPSRRKYVPAKSGRKRNQNKC